MSHLQSFSNGRKFSQIPPPTSLTTGTHAAPQCRLHKISKLRDTSCLREPQLREVTGRTMRCELHNSRTIRPYACAAVFLVTSSIAVPTLGGHLLKRILPAHHPHSGAMERVHLSLPADSPLTTGPNTATRAHTAKPGGHHPTAHSSSTPHANPQRLAVPIQPAAQQWKFLGFLAGCILSSRSQTLHTISRSRCRGVCVGPEHAY